MRLQRQGHRARSGLCAAIALTALMTGPSSQALQTEAQNGPVAVLVRMDPEAPAIGDALHLEIEVLADPGVELLMPDFGDALDRFKIVDFVPREKLDPNGQIRAQQRYTLRVPTSGPQQIPSILVEFVDRRAGQPTAPEGQDAYEILPDPIPFHVDGILPEAAAATLSPPLGPLAPIQSPKTPRWPWVIGLLLVGLIALPWAVQKLRAIRDQASVRSAWEIARTELDELLAGPPPDQENIDAYFVRLSGIARTYLEARFGVRSPELTTERFLEAASDSPELSEPHQLLLRDLLLQCDLVKFAQVVPTESTIQHIIALAGRFIDETRDRPASEEIR
ncbi:hypothetical protein MK280_01680 [Myxococcota bacterium]|nr:hypothetical protein [Myxococcota bacterium]